MTTRDEAKVILALGITGIALVAGAIGWIWGTPIAVLALGLLMCVMAVALG
jgi:hypothetical protein